MRTWNLHPNDPLSITLASDARISPPDYTNDHIWELKLAGSEPPALVIQTTYGLRARSFRIFPRFLEGDLAITNLSDFHQPPSIRHLFPNSLKLQFEPLQDIDVTVEYWVPESHAIAGRFTLQNKDNWPRTIRLQLIGQLSPTTGQRLAPVEIQSTWVLSGQAVDLYPLLFCTAGPRSDIGSYPSLVHIFELEPGESRQVTWVCAASHTVEESFSLARAIAARPWEAEQSYIEMLNAGQLEIYTGNHDWDIALMLSQRTAQMLLMGPTDALPHISFVSTRQPDQGYSRRGDGLDYDYLWNGQSALEAWYLSDLLLPGQAEIIQGILLNYLAVQGKDGAIDWKPGLVGQRSFIIATPVLASLAWKVFEISADLDFLRKVYPGLLRFFFLWFQSSHDRDGDGVPEWDHPIQTGAEDHPRYATWYDWAQGIDISTAETPSLSTFLFRECQSLIRIASLLEAEVDLRGWTDECGWTDESIRTHPSIREHKTLLAESAERLRLAIEIAWDGEQAGYFDIDRDTHYSTVGEKLAEWQGAGEVPIQRSFEHPIRLLIHWTSNRDPSTLHSLSHLEDSPLASDELISNVATTAATNAITSQLSLAIHGTSATGQPRVERISGDRFKRALNRSVFTGERVYQSIEFIEVFNINPTDKLVFFSADYHSQDQTSLLPLWAGIPDAERAAILIEKTITSPSRFWQIGGLPAFLESFPFSDGDDHTHSCRAVNMHYNTMIGQGLIQYGYREQAAELIERLMTNIIDNLKQQQTFFRYYDADTRQGNGDHNTLQGLAPLGLFMDVLGVKIISPKKVILEGYNPFPWPVTVKYRGMTILRQKDTTNVIFPDGQSLTITDPTRQVVSLGS